MFYKIISFSLFKKINLQKSDAFAIDHKYILFEFPFVSGHIKVSRWIFVMYKFYCILLVCHLAFTNEG